MLILNSCNKKKYTEVIEVPLPRAAEKMTIGDPSDIKAEEGAFAVEKLDFKYDELLPALDPLTMELNYGKHYLAYTNALNKAVVDTEFEKLSIEEILIKVLDSDSNLKNCAGAYFNYNLFWKSIGKKTNTVVIDSLSNAIVINFESFDLFKKEFISKANNHIGSGWIWLLVDNSGKLQITTTLNNENPLMINAIIKGKPLLTINLWEHAYYLNYQQRRKEYIDAVFKIIDWKKVSARFETTDRP
jgi:Fe-Mn family superoxide dismutase